MTLQIKQESNPASEGWWSWAVWLEGPEEELDQVNAVVYILDPSFEQPVQRKTSRENKFRLQSLGWGEFRIEAKVELKDSSAVSLFHDLRFGSPAPAQQPSNASRKAQRVFVSSSLANAHVAVFLRKELESQEIEVVDPSTAAKGTSWSNPVVESIKSSDAVVVVRGKTESTWVDRDVRTARHLQVPVFEVEVDPDAEKSALPQFRLISDKKPFLISRDLQNLAKDPSIA